MDEYFFCELINNLQAKLPNSFVIVLTEGLFL